MTNGELSIRLSQLCDAMCIATSNKDKCITMRKFAAFKRCANRHGAHALAAEASKYEALLSSELAQRSQQEKASCSVNTPR